MPKVIINGEECEGDVGERLIDIARRNNAHIGFVCEGLLFFLFKTSACRVLQGAEHLSPPSDVEQKWFPQSWLDAGHRMACEATLEGSGPVEIISYAEELRLNTVHVFAPPEGTNIGQNIGTLTSNMGRVMVGQLARFPVNILGAAPIWFKRVQNREIAPICLPLLPGIVRDGTKVVQRMVTPASNRKWQPIQIEVEE